MTDAELQEWHAFTSDLRQHAKLQAYLNAAPRAKSSPAEPKYDVSEYE